MEQYVWLTILGIGIIAALAFFFGGDDLEDRFVAGLMGLFGAAGVAMISWAIYVAAHFIAKYW